MPRGLEMPRGVFVAFELCKCHAEMLSMQNAMPRCYLCIRHVEMLSVHTSCRDAVYVNVMLRCGLCIRHTERRIASKYPVTFV
jgi:hypothetical protein